jgi:hypothetical protein
MYLFLTIHRQDVLTSSRKITARKLLSHCDADGDGLTAGKC